MMNQSAAGRVRSGHPLPPRTLHGRGFSTSAPHGPFPLRGGAPPGLLAPAGPRIGSWRPQPNHGQQEPTYDPPLLTLGSCLPYASVRDAGAPAYGPPFPEPPLDATPSATPNARVLVSSGDAFVEENVYLVHNDLSKAYRLLKVQAEIKRAGVPWGHVAICLVLEKDPRGVVAASFREPEAGSEHLVAVKGLNMRVVEWYNRRGGTENPNVELAAAEFVGDNEHVLRHEEVLTDGERRYIVMPFCNGGDVCDAIPWLATVGEVRRAGWREDVARKHFRRMLECLAHTQANGVCHGDLSPENIMLHNGRCIFIDLGMSLRVAPSPDRRKGGRVLIPWQGPRGKTPYMAPELWAKKEEKPFDGFSVDIHALGASLYAMLTGLKLYYFPSPSDQKYQLFVLENGLCDEVSVLDYIHQRALTDKFAEENTVDILARLKSHRELSHQVKHLIRGMTMPNPEQRMTLEQVVKHEWVVGPQPARGTPGWEGRGATIVGAAGLPSDPGSSERITHIKNGPPTMRAARVSLPQNVVRRHNTPGKPTSINSIASEDSTGKEAYFNLSRKSPQAVDQNPAVTPPTQRKRWALVPRLLPAYYPARRRCRLFNADAETIAARLSEFARVLGMSARFDESTIVLETADGVRMRLSLFQAPDRRDSGCIAADLQLLGGCSVAFQALRCQIFSAADGKPFTGNNVGALFEEARNQVCDDSKEDHEDETERSYLAQAAKLMGRENVDDMLLGLEFLSFLTDPKKTNLEIARAASRAVLIVKSEPNASLQDAILSLLRSEHHPENPMPDKNLTVYKRRLALQVFANALETNAKYDSDSSAPVFSASSWTLVLSSLVEALGTAETNPHDAFLAARSLRRLCRSSCVRDTLRRLRVRDAVEVCVVVGRETHRPLEKEVDAIAIALHNDETSHSRPLGSADVDAPI